MDVCRFEHVIEQSGPPYLIAHGKQAGQVTAEIAQVKGAIKSLRFPQCVK